MEKQTLLDVKTHNLRKCRTENRISKVVVRCEKWRKPRNTFIITQPDIVVEKRASNDKCIKLKQ